MVHALSHYYFNRRKQGEPVIQFLEDGESNVLGRIYTVNLSNTECHYL